MTFATEDEARAYWLQLAEEKWSACTACPLALSRSRVVYGEGSPSAELLVVAEAPGEEEDQTGHTLWGKAGTIFRRSAAAPGIEILDRSYLSNTVVCRPGGNRKPSREERNACQPRLLELMSILQPRMLLLLGGTAGFWFGVREVGASRGLIPRAKWPELGWGGLRLKAVLLTWHPSYILHCDSRVKKRTAFAQLVNDLKITRKALDQIKRKEAEHGQQGGVGVGGEHPDAWKYQPHDGDGVQDLRE